MKKYRRNLSLLQKLHFKYLNHTNGLFKNANEMLYFYTFTLFLLSVAIFYCFDSLVIQERNEVISFGFEKPFKTIPTIIFIILTSLFDLDIVQRALIKEKLLYKLFKRFSFIINTMITIFGLILAVVYLFTPETPTLESSLVADEKFAAIVIIYFMTVLFNLFDKYKD